MRSLIDELNTPMGPLRLLASDGRLRVLAFADHWDRVTARLDLQDARPGHSGDIRARLGRYLDGEYRALDELPIDPAGTEFRLRVWRAVRAIPAGQTRSYADVARAVGAPSAVRAVGTANAQNPIWIVVPCHRVIGSDGRLHGYGGGLPRKAWLLEHERAQSVTDPTATYHWNEPDSRP